MSNAFHEDKLLPCFTIKQTHNIKLSHISFHANFFYCLYDHKPFTCIVCTPSYAGRVSLLLSLSINTIILS